MKKAVIVLGVIAALYVAAIAVQYEHCLTMGTCL